MTKIKFNHDSEMVLEAIGFAPEEVKKLADIAWADVVEPKLKMLDEKLPLIVEETSPFEDEDGFNDKLGLIMPDYTEVCEEVQDKWIENGFEPSMALGFMLTYTADKVTSSLAQKIKMTVGAISMGALSDAIEDRKEKAEPTAE